MKNMNEGNVIVPTTVIRKHSNGKVEIYKRHEELGRGGFATVFRVTNEATGESFALKATSRERLNKPKILQKHRSEVAIQRKLNHPNVLRLYDFFEDSQNTYMVLELCPGGSIRDLIKAKNHLSEEETVNILKDVIDGLCYLHDNRIIHRDLKLENFLIGADKKVKIADFGLSAKLDYDDEKKFTVCGTPNYLSPELLASTNHGHSYEVDIWAIGVCAFAMLTGTPPFETRRTKDTYEHIKNCQYRFPFELKLSPESKSFIKGILQLKPELRPSSYELQQHPFMQSLGPYPANSPPQETKEKEHNKLKERREHHERRHHDEHCENDNDNVKHAGTKHHAHNYESTTMPEFCVSRFCDHSEKYGLGYLLINGAVGALFNDHSRMIMDPFEEFVQYYESYQDQTPKVLRKDDVNEIKKLSILQKFAESLKKTKTMFTLPENHLDRFTPMHHVKYWSRNDDATLFRMDDRNIQVNFNDRTKMIIFWQSKKLFTVTTIKESGRLIPLEDLTKVKGLDDQRRRFMTAKAIIAQMSNQNA
ncbi:CAMK family protein kinase [Tritrichomonas foetus]|uniref:Serine/threonine-protein kinase PLK n=1 Tax=Tritrichomonas foetus TaxID=1144522 RepID=A0A1J4KZM2_9EUKA|nr:CAMK family protein kinase [Tritrichomonas foetus]|eukprot:OHT15140.1 CAMK family protein kinase [Tritrichomonas foetus]